MTFYRRLALVLAIFIACATMVAISLAQDDPPANVPADEANSPSPAQLSNSIFLPMTRNASGEVSQLLLDAALAAVAADTGVAAERLTIANATKADYTLTARVGYEFKVLERATGNSYGIMLDADGNRLDAAQLDEAEAAAYRARYGVYEPALADMLAAGQVSGATPVIIWLKEPQYTPPARPDPHASFRSEAEAAAFQGLVDTQRSEHVAQVTAPFVARLSGMGLEAQSDPYAPVIYTTLDATALRAMEQWAEIDTIYLDRAYEPLDVSAQDDLEQPALNVARTTIRADVVHGRGFTGSGVRVGVIEVGGRAAANPYMAFTQDATYACSTPSGHSTAVAGMVRSTHGTYRGVAYGSTLRVGGSCGGWGSELTNRSSAAVTWGARVLNLSWGCADSPGHPCSGVPDSLARFYDDMVINRYVTVVAAAGNRRSPCVPGDAKVVNPASAYNIITVGNFDDKGTTSWSDDGMGSCSSYVDPPSTRGDREKPEVTAPGTKITSLINASPWVGYYGSGSGTSFAAPMVTGMAALMMQRNSGLTVWPEAVKAISMVSAINDIEGSDRLSEYDGAGGIVVDRADDVARQYNFRWNARTYSCSTSSTLEVFAFNSAAGYRIRAAIVWDNPPSYSSYSARPSADLDLQIVNSSGAVVAYSQSYDNTYEIVDFFTPSAGVYRVNVRKYRCDASPSYLGFAIKAHS